MAAGGTRVEFDHLLGAWDVRSGRFLHAFPQRMDDFQFFLSASIADIDDPTVRRCTAFAKSWGYGRLVMLNAYAYRATDPSAMKAARDPVGPRNDEVLAKWRDVADVIVAAWGNHCTRARVEEIRRAIPTLHYLRLTKRGYPGHPLYLPRDLRPRRWGTVPDRGR